MGEMFHLLVNISNTEVSYSIKKSLSLLPQNNVADMTRKKS